jgi:hypothetical protein
VSAALRGWSRYTGRVPNPADCTVRTSILPCSLVALAALLPSTALADRVAVVIGVGSYAKLGESLELPGASQGARDLARLLQQDAGYDQVLPLTDALATRSAIRDLLLENLPAQLSAEDSLLVFFAGHGVGGDFGEPYLLPYDADPADLQGTGLSVDELGSSLRNALQVASLVMITDAVHDQRLDDLVLVGPNAKSWPDLADEFFSLSACSPKEIPGETPFGALLGEGMSGAADSSGDGVVSASELHRYLLDRMASGGFDAHPAESGTYNPELAVAWVSKGPADFAPPEPEPEPEPERNRRRSAGVWAAAVGLGVTGSGAAFYFDGMKIYEQANSAAPGDPVLERYERDKALAPVLMGIGAATMVTGGVLVVLPSPTGATVGVNLRF